MLSDGAAVYSVNLDDEAHVKTVMSACGLVPKANQAYNRNIAAILVERTGESDIGFYQNMIKRRKDK